MPFTHFYFVWLDILPIPTARGLLLGKHLHSPSRAGTGEPRGHSGLAGMTLNCLFLCGRHYLLFYAPSPTRYLPHACRAEFKRVSLLLA